MSEYYKGKPYPADHPYDRTKWGPVNFDVILESMCGINACEEWAPRDTSDMYTPDELTYSEKYGGGWGVTATECALSFDQPDEVAALETALTQVYAVANELQWKLERLTGEPYCPF